MNTVLGFKHLFIESHYRAPPPPRHTTTSVKISEELLWRFIDDDLDPAEEAAVSRAISENEEVGNLYLELLETHDQFATFFQDKQRAQGATSFRTMLGTMRDISN